MPDMPRSKFNSPWTVENIETELNGTKSARGNLTMTEKLAQKVETSTYNTDKAALDAEIAVLTPAVIKATDDGAKNKLPITIQSQTVRTVQFAVNGDGSITANGTVTGGDVYLNFETSIGDKYVGMILSGGTANLKICISKEGSGQTAVYSDSSKGVEIPDNATNTLFLFAANGTQLSNVTVKPMICTASDWAVSQKFVPYCPTLYELYQMVLALQSGTRSLSMQPETLTKGEEPETESREEER
jgi:hypothetical protein